MVLSSALTVMAAVASGAILFVFGEILKITWLNQLQEYKQLKKKIAYLLVYYANIYTNPIDLADGADRSKHEKASEDLREMASEVSGYIETLYTLKLFIPSRRELQRASSNLIALSNGMYCPYKTDEKQTIISANKQSVIEIKAALKIRKYE